MFSISKEKIKKKSLIFLLMIIYIVANITNTTYAQLDKYIDSKYTVPIVLTTKKMATVSSEITGTVSNVSKYEGDMFNKDDVILEFDCSLLKAKSKVAKSQVDLTKAKYNSYEGLSNLDGASKIELQTSLSEYEQALAEQEIAEYNVKQCVKYAPFKGQMVKLYVKQYESVKDGDELYDIVDNSELEVSAIVPSDWLSWLKEGDGFDIYLIETNENYRAKVNKIIYSVDAISQSIRVIGSIEGASDGLFIGESGRAKFRGP